MRIYYFAPADIQIARVDRQCIVRFCEALKRIGIDVILIAAGIHLAKYEKAEHDLVKLYGIQTPFTIKLLPSVLRQTSGAYWKALVRLVLYFKFIIRKFVVDRKNPKNVRSCLYFKNHLYYLPLALARNLDPKNVRLVLEAHLPPKNKFQRHVLTKVDGIVANSHNLKAVLEQCHGIKDEKMIGTHQGVNLEYVESIRMGKEECRRRLGLPLDKKLAIYTGKVYDGYQEIEYYAEAAGLLPYGIELVIVGGRADHVERVRRRYASKKNLHFIGFVPPAEIFYYQFAADMLLLYYSPGNPLNDFRSPGKLFDYMASGNPIIAAAYPVLHEVLRDGENSLLIPIADPPALAAAIRQLAANQQLGRRLGSCARLDVSAYTWVERARQISSFVFSLK